MGNHKTMLTEHIHDGWRRINQREATSRVLLKRMKWGRLLRQASWQPRRNGLQANAPLPCCPVSWHEATQPWILAHIPRCFGLILSIRGWFIPESGSSVHLQLLALHPQTSRRERHNTRYPKTFWFSFVDPSSRTHWVVLPGYHDPSLPLRYGWRHTQPPWLHQEMG